MNTTSRIAIGFCCICGCAGLFAGGRSAGPARSPAPIRLAGGGIAAIQQTPEFKAADAALRAHRRAEAAAYCQQLLSRPGITAEQRSYLQKQLEICRGRRLQPAAQPAALSTDTDCGPKALKLACSDVGLRVSETRLRELACTTDKGTSMAGLAAAAKAVGLKPRGVQITRQALGDIPCPAIAWWRGHHFVEVRSVDGDEDSGSALIHDPEEAKSKRIPREQLWNRVQATCCC